MKVNGYCLIMISVFCMSQQGSASESILKKPLHKTLGTRIIGGEEATVGEFPSMVSLQAGSWGHFCGGSLIRSNWVITAAHCVKSPSPGLKIVTGLHNLKDQSNSEKFSPKKIIIHPDYEKEMQADFDVALIQLDGNSRFKPTEINPSEIEIPNEEGAYIVTTAGWGYLKEGGNLSNILMKVLVPLINSTNCKAAYPGQITDRMICAGLDKGGKDSCQGDSGGPLFDTSSSGKHNLIGIVSWGEGCARPKKYGVYSKVNSAFDWIESQIRQN